jgi:hypothetical protein
MEDVGHSFYKIFFISTTSTSGFCGTQLTVSIMSAQSSMLRLLKAEPPTTDVEICCRFEDIATEGHASVSAYWWPIFPFPMSCRNLEAAYQKAAP